MLPSKAIQNLLVELIWHRGPVDRFYHKSLSPAEQVVDYLVAEVGLLQRQVPLGQSDYRALLRSICGGTGAMKSIHIMTLRMTMVRMEKINSLLAQSRSSAAW